MVRRKSVRETNNYIRSEYIDTAAESLRYQKLHFVYQKLHFVYYAAGETNGDHPKGVNNNNNNNSSSSSTTPGSGTSSCAPIMS